MEFVVPNWEVPQNIKAVSTTRIGGVSAAPYDALNLGSHVNDDLNLVLRNRKLLKQQLALPSNPVWLNQTHSASVLDIHDDQYSILDADGTITTRPNIVCTVMTADCLPVLLTDINGTQVSAVHAGWRGLAGGILENAVSKFEQPVIAWVGPAISWDAFEVGEEVREQFLSVTHAAVDAFKPSGNEGKWLANISLIAEQRLLAAGVKTVYQSGLCTFTDSSKFFSYRRDGITGRQASLIWIDNN